MQDFIDLDTFFKTNHYNTCVISSFIHRILLEYFKLCFSLADTAVKKKVKIFNYHKTEATPMFI